MRRPMIWILKRNPIQCVIQFKSSKTFQSLKNTFRNDHHFFQIRYSDFERQMNEQASYEALSFFKN